MILTVHRGKVWLKSTHAGVNILAFLSLYVKMTFMKVNVIDVGISRKALNRQGDLFKLLSHPARLAILEMLRSGEECVCHMETVLGYRQAYLSQQIAILRSAGVIQDRRDGWNIYYRVILPQVYDVMDAARIALKVDPRSTTGRIQEDTCPCPKCSAAAKNNE